MRHLTILVLLLLFPQTQGPVNVPVPIQQFTIGYGSSQSQVLGKSPEQLQAIPTRPHYYNEGMYRLSFSVQNYFPSYPGYFTAEVSFGTQELCEMSGWGTINAKQVTLECPGPNYIVIDQALPAGGPVQGSQPIAISFSVPNWQLMFSNISLTFTPDP